MKYTFLALALFFYALNTSAQETEVTEQAGLESEITIAVNPANEDEIIIAAMGSDSPIIIYTSSDGGANWSQSSFGNGIADPVLTYGDNNTAYLTYLDFGNTLEMSLGASTDGGVSWETEVLTLDGQAADRQWIKRDNMPNSPHYGNIYISYFHPEGGPDIQIVKIDEAGNVGTNHPIHSTAYDYVQNPALDIAPSGDIVICFIAEDGNGNRKIVAVHSTDGSENFSSESTVATINMFANGNPITNVIGFAPGAASRLGNSLQMSIDKSSGPFAGRAYLTWTDFTANDPAEGMDVYLSYSDDNGQNWSTPKIVNDDNVPSSHQYYSGIDVNPLGMVCVSWYDRRSDPDNDALTDFYFSCSEDGGEHFQNSMKVNSASSDHTAVTDGAVTFGVGEYTSLAATSSEAYVVWSDGRTNDGDMDVYFAKASLDNINSVEEVLLSPDLLIENLYPNPVSNGTMRLTLKAAITGEIEISIFSATGHLLNKEKRFLRNIGENELDIALPNFSNGSYILEIKYPDGLATKKIVVK